MNRLHAVLASIIALLAASTAIAQPVTQVHRLAPQDLGEMMVAPIPFEQGGVAQSESFLIGSAWIPGELTAGGMPGVAYVYDRQSGDLVRLLEAPGVDGDAKRVSSVAITETHALIGVTDHANARDDGVVHVFDTTSDQPIGSILIPNASGNADTFGEALAIQGHHAIIGSPFAGRAFYYDLTTLQVVHELHSPIEFGDRGSFGGAVAMDGSLAVVGASIEHNVNGEDAGAAYVFDLVTGDLLHQLLPDDGQTRDYFGNDVAIEGSTIVVGSYFDDDRGAASGSVYVFDASSGAQLRKIVPSDATTADYFGDQVAIDNGIIAASSRRDNYDGIQDAGSVYLYETSNGNLIRKITPSLPTSNGQFGRHLDLSFDSLVATAISYGSAGTFDHEGIAFVFAEACPGDCNGSGAVDFADLVAMLFEFGGVSTVGCDADSSGTVNFADLVTALFAFGPCP